MKNQHLHSVLKILISVVAILAVVVGGGIAYVWYMGQQVEEPVAATMPVATTAPIMAPPPKPADNVAVGVSIQSLAPVEPGKNGLVSAKTLPDTDCTIEVEYGDIKSTDSGLLPKKADEFGVVSWTWTVEPSTPHGEWPVKITCSRSDDNSAVVVGDLVVGPKES